MMIDDEYMKRQENRAKLCIYINIAQAFLLWLILGMIFYMFKYLSRIG